MDLGRFKRTRKDEEDVYVLLLVEIVVLDAPCVPSNVNVEETEEFNNTICVTRTY